MPFEKIVYPFFRNYASFLSYSQSVKSLLLVVDHLYNELDLHKVMENKKLEYHALLDLQSKVKPLFIKNQKHNYSLEKIDYFLKKIILSFQLFKRFYEKNSTDFTYFREQLFNTAGYGYLFTDEIFKSLPFLSHFLYDFWEFCIALRKIANETEKFHKIFKSLFYIELYDLIMDFKATQVIDIPTFIKKFSEKFMGGSGTANFKNFFNISNAVLTSYFDLIRASVEFLHRDGSELKFLSTKISSLICSTVD